MVLKKPYAFLIKNFMLIHIILSVLMIYVCSQYRNILSFIKQYINNTASISTAGSIIGLTLFLAIVLIIGIAFAIFWLLKYKKKPKLLYLINIGFYTIILILTIVLSSTFANLNEIILDAKTIRLYRDMVNIIIIIQYIFIIAMIIRTLGFDIKKFDFKADANELDIDTSDSEEFEVNVGLNTNKIMRFFRRHLRELKYYYEDNKLVIKILGIIAIVICLLMIAPKIIGRERTYGQNQTVSTLKFQMRVTDSYTTKLKYDGTDVSIKDHTYVILKTSFLGKIDGKNKIDTDRFVLKVGKKTYSPSLKQYDYFTDLGYGYSKQNLAFNTIKPYLLVFVVDDKYIKKSKKLFYTDYNLEERKIKIKPTDIDTTKEISTANLTNELNYKNTLIGDGTIKINSFEFGNSYDNISAGYNKKILKLEVDNKIEKYSNFDFFNYFVSLYYTKDKDTKKISFTNRTPRNNSNLVYLETSKKVEEADKIYLEIRIRTNIYKYIIKGGE